MAATGGAVRAERKRASQQGVTSAIGLIASVLSLVACSDLPSMPGKVSSHEPHRLFYYAEPPGDAAASRLMAVEPTPGAPRVSEVDLEPAFAPSDSADACSANAWDASWSSAEHRGVGIAPRALVLASQQGHLYAIPRSLHQPPIPRRISAERRAASIGQCTVWPDLADYSESLVLYQRGHQRYYATLGEGGGSLPRVLPSALGTPLRHTRTGGFAGYLFVAGSAVRLSRLHGGGARTIETGIEQLEVAGPLGSRYVLLADGDWYAFDPRSASGEQLSSLDAQRAVGWFANSFTRLGLAYQERGGGHLVTGQNTGRSFIVSIDYDRRSAVQLRMRPSDRPIRLLGQHGHEHVVAFRYIARFQGEHRGEFVTVDPASGSISVLAQGGRFAAGRAPTHVLADDTMVFAGEADRPTVADLDDGDLERLGSAESYVARQAVDPQYEALSGGSLVRGDRLVYVDRGRVYSIDASRNDPSASQLLLGTLPGQGKPVYEAAYKTGGDEGGLLFLKRREGATDVAYINPKQAGSLAMLVADPERTVYPVNGEEVLWR